MSFWNSLKPSAPRPAAPTHVDLSADKKTLTLTWADGTKDAVSARRLRQYCPCAGCVEEWTGKRTFAPETIPEEMTITQVESVGNYALGFTFGDEHNTGIFEWGTLKRLATGEPGEP